MSASNDTPLKRFMSFWAVLGAFLFFGIIALVLIPLTNSPDVTAADKAGAVRRLAVRELVEAEQLKNLSRLESGETVQVPPSEVFALVGSQLAASKPSAMKDDKFRDPAAANVETEEASQEIPVSEEASLEEAVPASKVVETVTTPTDSPSIGQERKIQKNSALTPQAPRSETSTQFTDPSAL